MRSPDAATGAAMFARIGLFRVVGSNRFWGLRAYGRRAQRIEFLGRIGHAGAAAAWLSDGPSPIRLIHRVRTPLEGERHMWSEDTRECGTDSADPFELLDGTEWPERVAVGDDAAGEYRADAWEAFYFSGGGDVHIEVDVGRDGG